MGNMCEIICSGVFDTKVVLATCEPNGVWSLGKEDACKGLVINFSDVIFLILTPPPPKKKILQENKLACCSNGF